MEDRKIGLVKEIKGIYAVLEIKRASACGSCDSCSAKCEEKNIEIMVRNSLGVKIGDRVEIESVAGGIFKALMLLYFVPFLALVLGIAIGWKIFKGNEVYSFLLGLLSLAVSYLLIRLYDKRSRQEIITMVEII